MKLSFYLVVVFLSFALGCEEAKCPNYSITQHYRDLKCKPIYSPTDSCCPISYNCEVFDQIHKHPDKCFYSGKAYAHREKLPDELTETTCRVACFCRNSDPGHSEFTCAQKECPKDFGVTPKPDCTWSYELDQCCPEEVCLTARNQKKTCAVDGKTYLDGEKIYPEKDKCSVCVCKNGEVNCRNINCGTEIGHTVYLMKGEGVKFWGRNSCCPIGYVEPSDTDEIVTHAAVPNPTVGTCKFGKLTLNVGDEVKTTESNACTKCECIVPPNISCIQKPECH